MDDARREDDQLRSAALQNANSILAARQRAEEELLRAKDALQQKTQELAQSLAMMRATLESTTDGILVTDGSANVTGFNDNFPRIWGIPRNVLDAGKHFKIIDVIEQQFANPVEFRPESNESTPRSPPETYDLLELKDAG